jgi:hypothetical protein
MNRTEHVQAVLWLDAVAAAAKDRAAELRATLTDDARAEYAEQGTAPTWRIPDVATVASSVSRETVALTDESAFTKWVGLRYPDEIEEILRVNPSWMASFLANATVSGDVVADAATGEVVPGLTVRAGGRLTGLSIRPSHEAKTVFGAVAQRALAELAVSAGPAVPRVLAELEASHAVDA